MAAGRLLIPGWARALDSDGNPIPARVSLFNVGTDARASVYSDEGLSVPLVNPVQSNSAGRFPAIWASDATAYDWSVEAPYGPPGAPFTGTGLTTALSADVLVADAAAASASAAETAATNAEQAYDDILAMVNSAPSGDPLVIASKASKAANLLDMTDPAAALANIGGNLSSNITMVNAGTGAVTRSVQDRLRDTVSVLDFIPPSKHAGIKAGTNTEDLTGYFQAAAAASASAASVDPLALGQVYVPNGRYHIRKVGIQGVVFRGQSREGTVLRAFSAGTAADFMLDAMLERDGVTTTTVGTGWAECLSIEGTMANGSASGRSGLRTYGGGNTPCDLDIRNLATGLSCGLPIWQRVSNVFARNCDVGFYTFHNSPGDNGTSTSFFNCWALDCTTYGFHISQLYYSSFIGCVSQDAGTHNFFVEGNKNGLPACYSLMFIGCATEGGGTPFYFKKVRQLTVDNPRVILPDNDVDFITFDDCTGSIRDYESASSPGGGKYHLNVLNHTGGTGSIALMGDGLITLPSAQATSVSELGPTVNGVRRLAVGGALIGGYVSSPSALASSVNDYGVPIGAAVARLTPTSGGSSITGLASGASGGIDGQRLLIHNSSLSDTLTLVSGSASSAAANRLDLSGGADKVIPVRGSLELWYDAAIQRWHDVA